ncbi:MAG: lipid A export permease/ATP-binding protein MsbA [Gammaproteobacteria bacterium]|jgi:ATP-binding cassette, subfamily B, bacterial MsbA|nr:lipid A export permease/ATP-binding protein MsbA [Gammaproteobacteria bacterium]
MSSTNSTDSSLRPVNESGAIALYQRLLAYLSPLRPFFLLGIFGFVIFSAASLWFFDLLEGLIDTINSGAAISSEQRLRIPLTLIIIVGFRGLGGFLGPYYMAYISNHVVHRIRTELMEKFVSLPSSYFDRNTSAHLLSTVTFNVTQISAAVSDALTVILREGFLVLALFGYLLYLNWKLTILFVAIMPIISLVVVYASKKFRKHSSRIQISMGDVTHILSETLKGMKVVKTFSAEEQVREKFNEASERNLKQNLKMMLVQSISTPVVQVLVASALSLLLWFAMSPAVLTQMSPGEFVTYIVVAGSMLKPIRQLSKINAVVQKGLAAAQSIFVLLDEDTEKDLGSKEINRLEGRVEFQDVCFTYDGKDGHVLHNINFSCNPGETIAIVGKSGSGKSTLVNLVPRFYQQNSGNIVLDGISSSEITLQSLRRQIALVSQQVVLFNGSVRENIAYGELSTSSDDNIRKALENANALGFVEELDEGLDTRIGDDGFLLSGGQRQRLAIARALLKDAPILILDEATSALDSESEKAIQAALEVLIQGRTTFVIAHRLSTIESADKIIVLDKGKIVESGSHDELLEAGGHYKQLHQMQFS